MDYSASAEVARRFGIELNSLTSYLTRHPHLRPKKKIGPSFMWTEEEVEALARHRMRPISRGPRSKKRMKT